MIKVCVSIFWWKTNNSCVTGMAGTHTHTLTRTKMFRQTHQLTAHALSPVLCNHARGSGLGRRNFFPGYCDQTFCHDQQMFWRPRPRVTVKALNNSMGWWLNHSCGRWGECLPAPNNCWGELLFPWTPNFKIEKAFEEWSILISPSGAMFKLLTERNLGKIKYLHVLVRMTITTLLFFYMVLQHQ